MASLSPGLQQEENWTKMEEMHKVVQKGCLVHRKMETLVVGVDAIKALNDVFSIKSQALRVRLSELTFLPCVARLKDLRTELALL